MSLLGVTHTHAQAGLTVDECMYMHHIHSVCQIILCQCCSVCEWLFAQGLVYICTDTEYAATSCLLYLLLLLYQESTTCTSSVWEQPKVCSVHSSCRRSSWTPCRGSTPPTSMLTCEHLLSTSWSSAANRPTCRYDTSSAFIPTGLQPQSTGSELWLAQNLMSLSRADQSGRCWEASTMWYRCG